MKIIAKFFQAVGVQMCKYFGSHIAWFYGVIMLVLIPKPIAGLDLNLGGLDDWN